jgi:N-succinyldiaminopimelate aminotransferase
MVSMFNPRLTETLTDFPFARLNALIAPIAPPAHLSMINMSVGEPQGAMPAFARQIVNDEIDGWNRYPPNQGIPDLNLSIVEWLNRRYRLPAGLLDPAQHVIPTAGSKEGVYIISTVVTPQQKAGAKPVVALPNPFYQAYLGGAVLSGAEPLLVNANAETGFLPDFESVDEATWKRMSVVYLCSPANPQGAIAGIDYLQKLLAKCREHDAVLAVDECYAEIYTREPPPGALEAALAMDTTGGTDPFRNLAVFHSLSKRSNAAGLRSGFMAGDPRLVAMTLRWRTYGGPQMPFAVQ